MKFVPLFAVLFLAAFGMAGCKKDADPATGTGLAGTWKLTSREGCYCPRGPVPNETVFLNATDFSFTKDGQVVRRGAYAQSTAAKCGTTELVPVLGFTDATNNTFRNVPFTLNGDKLVLDYSNRCISDSPVDTYRRLP